MRINRTLRAAAAVLAFSFVAASVAESQAQTRRVQARPLTIQKRSFLNPGPVVPVNSLRNYVTAVTTLQVPANRYTGSPLQASSPLPQRFDPPGRPSPLFNF